MNDLGIRMAWTLGLMSLALAAAPVAADRYIVEPVMDVIDTRTDASQGFSQAELDQMLAPVALYPDSLLTQVLIAATYPLEIVAAARWSRQNPHLDGEEAVAAVADRDWDPSVKAMVAFPELLARLDENLEWTRSLGDAMLFQEAQVMDSIQFLRARADAAGSLETNEFTRVIREERTIIIEPAVTRVVHVPFYDPWVVFGPWWRPMHPPFFWGPPTVFIHSHPGFFWGSGVRVSSGFFFSSFWWPSSNVIIVNNPRWHSPRHRPPWPHFVPGQRWKHNPVHRRGVHYRHPEVRQRYAGHRGGDWSGRNRPGAESGRPQFTTGNVPRRENRDIAESRPGRESRADVPGARTQGSRSGSVSGGFAERPARPDAGALERRIGQSRNDRTAATGNSNRSGQVTRPQVGQSAGTAFRAPQATNRDTMPTRTPQASNRNATPTRTPQASNRNATPTRTPQASNRNATPTRTEQLTNRNATPTRSPQAAGRSATTMRTPQATRPQSTPRATSQPTPTRQSQPQRGPAPSAAPTPNSRASGTRESSNRSTESRGSGSSRQDSRGDSGRAGMSRDTRSNR